MEKLESIYKLDEHTENIEEKYRVYIAKKKGLPKSDYPNLGLKSNVKATSYDRFVLCIFTKSLINLKQSNAT